MITLDRARAISDMAADRNAMSPLAPRPVAHFQRVSMVDPHDLPIVRELFGTQALLAWSDAGGDATVFLRGNA